MINRENFKLTRKWLAHRQPRRSGYTMKQDHTCLKHILEWADDRSFYRANLITPPLPIYLAQAGLSHMRQERIGMTARVFFDWLRKSNPRRATRLDDIWMESLLPIGRDDLVSNQDPYTLDEIRQLCSVKPSRLTDLRTQAAAALMFVSGIRPGALVTLPVEAVNLGAGEIYQWPELGVMTKYRTRATTYMLVIHDLFNVIRAWDRMVRDLPKHDAWYAYVSNDGSAIIGGVATANRVPGLALELRRLCQAAGVHYRRPHEIRHGHATYALQQCTDMASYKAVSQNMMHSSIVTTDRVYVNMRAADIKRRIEAL